MARVAEMPATIRPAERRALTEDQANALLSAAIGHRLEGLFISGLMLGLRPGELTGLRWVDVDLKTTPTRSSASVFVRRGPLTFGYVAPAVAPVGAS